MYFLNTTENTDRYLLTVDVTRRLSKCVSETDDQWAMGSIRSRWVAGAATTKPRNQYVDMMDSREYDGPTTLGSALEPGGNSHVRQPTSMILCVLTDGWLQHDDNGTALFEWSRESGLRQVLMVWSL